MIPGISSRLWNGLHQLHAEGCAVNIEELYRSLAPVHLENQAPFAVQPVVPVRNGVLLLIPLTLKAVAPVTVERFEMTADWLPAPVVCFRPCRRHEGGLCVHTGPIHLRLSGMGSHLLNFAVLPRCLQANTELAGLLLGFCPGLASGIRCDERLEVTVSVRDAEGYDFRFPLVLQPGTAQSSSESSPLRAEGGASQYIHS